MRKTREHKFPPENGSGGNSFSDTVVEPSADGNQAYSPDASGNSILFTTLRADAQGRSALAVAAGRITTTIGGNVKGIIRIDVRGSCLISTKGSAGVLTIWDGNERHQMKFRQVATKDFTATFARSVRVGEKLQLALFLLARCTDTEELPGTLLEIDSVDMVLL